MVCVYMVDHQTFVIGKYHHDRTEIVFVSPRGTAYRLRPMVWGNIQKKVRKI